jgi:acyl-CoA reductase-like NAD-dependent aldehyde dehydrogenase
MTQARVDVTPLHIAGERVAGGQTLDVLSPYDGAHVGTVPMVGPDAVQAAVDAAAEAMAAGLPSHRRAEILDRAAAIVRERRQDLARTLALEAGKPVTQALVEVDRAVQTITFSAAEARTLAGRGVVVDAHPAGVGRRGWTLRIPIGVIGAITPFNFPLNLAAHKVAPAIAAGCGVVLKPPRQTPLTGIKLADILYEAGLPEPWLSVVVGPAAELVDVLVADRRVAMLTFTGSAEVGWALAARAPRKKVALELGNSTPLIVCADADLDAAAQTAAMSAFNFAGQSCISVQRVIVQAGVHDAFVDRLAAAAAAKQVGDPMSPEVAVGPLIDAGSRDRVLQWVDEAASTGSRLVTGDGARDGGGTCVSPVVLDEVDTAARVWRDEVFGPVVATRAFGDVEEAFELANGTDYGLQAGIYTSDLRVALEAAERLEFGGVTINETPTFRVDQMPYGGAKRSGHGREGMRWAIREMTEERLLVIDPR